MNMVNTKSNHPLQQEELMAYLDSELRPELATIAAAHLERCGDCRAAAAELRELSQQLAAWEIQMASPEIPPSLSAAIDAHVKSQKRRVAEHRRSWRQVLGTRRLLWAGGLASAVLLVVAVLVPNLLKYEPQALRRSYSMGDVIGPKSGPQAPQDQVRASQSVARANRQRAENRGVGGRFGNGSIGKFEAQGTINGVIETDGDLAQEKETAESPVPNGPMIVRTAQLALTTKEFDKARASAEEILKRHGGYIGELNVNAPAGSGRTLNATFRIPATQLDAALGELKKLGRVTFESQGGEEVTQQYVDLQARLANARHTEQRLSDLLSQRTGKLSDVLAFEKEIDRVRGEIESMEAQRKSLAKQVTYATLATTVTEEYSTPLQVAPPSTSTLIHNAAVEGYQAVEAAVVALFLFLLSAGPSILIWGGILFLIARIIWKKLRRRIA